MCLSLTPMKQRSDYVYLVSFPIVEHNVSLCKVRNTFLSFLSFRTKCSSLRYMGERQHPRDEILGAELKGKDVSWNISGRNITQMPALASLATVLDDTLRTKTNCEQSLPYGETDSSGDFSADVNWNCTKQHKNHLCDNRRYLPNRNHQQKDNCWRCFPAPQISNAMYTVGQLVFIQIFFLRGYTRTVFITGKPTCCPSNMLLSYLRVCWVSLPHNQRQVLCHNQKVLVSPSHSQALCKEM